MSHSLVVALSGGVGGAKLALGLSRILPAEELLIVANTGDDFEHLGLTVCPDIDTLTYALAGLDNPATGWGRGDKQYARGGLVPARACRKSPAMCAAASASGRAYCR